MTDVTNRIAINPVLGTRADLQYVLSPNLYPAYAGYFYEVGAASYLRRDEFKRYMEQCYDLELEHDTIPRKTKRMVEDGTIEKWMWWLINHDSTSFLKMSSEGTYDNLHTASTAAINEWYERRPVTLKTLLRRLSLNQQPYHVMTLAPLIFCKREEYGFATYVPAGVNDADSLKLRHIKEAYEANDIKWEFSHYENFTLRRTTVSKSQLYELQNYSFDFFRMFKKRLSVSEKEREAPIYGVELELSTRYSVRQLIDVVDTVWICAKQDSSITGKYTGRYEMVTLPATLKAHKQLWGKWFAALDMDKFDQSKDTNNGMHVHVAKESFNDLRHQRDFSWFFTNPMCAQFMIDFSERGALNNYCPMPDWQQHGNPSDTKTRKDIFRYLQGLRGAINVGSAKPTIEVRLFKGIVSYATLLKNLELVDAVFHFTSKGLSYSANPVREFFKWVRATNKNQYEALKEYLDKFVTEDEYTLPADVSLIIRKYRGKGSFLDHLNALHDDKLLLRDILDQLKFTPKVSYDVKINRLVWRGNTSGKTVVKTNTAALIDSDSKYLNRFKKVS